MKIKVFDFKIDSHDYSVRSDNRFKTMYVPTEDQAQSMIGWLKEFELQPYSYEHALETFIRTTIMYQHKLDYTAQFVSSHLTLVNSAMKDQPFCADIIDHTYETYRKVRVFMTLPDYFVVDTDDCITTDFQYDNDIDLTIFNLLLLTLPITINKIVTA